jgi:hypothetical protein
VHPAACSGGQLMSIGTNATNAINSKKRSMIRYTTSFVYNVYIYTLYIYYIYIIS